jgi:SAM-dependent methyltransferase
LNIPAVISELERVNWSFPSTGTRDGSIHTLHRFAGNFIPQIPSHLIQILSSPGELVLDPFVGSGTTIIEALRLNRNAVGNDRTRACVFIAEAKIAALKNPLRNDLRQQLARELAWPHLCQSMEPGLQNEGSSVELHTWYSPNTLAQLRFLWKMIEGVEKAQQPLLRLIFSDVLFSCASTGNALTSGGKPRRHHWGWIADNVAPGVPVDHEAVSIFLERLLATESIQVTELNSAIHGEVMHGDARKMDIASDSVDLIVTSPPYAGMIDYALAHRLLYLWMNWDLSEDRNAEIGARFKRKRRNLLNEYLADMDACWQEMGRVLKPGGACAVILGESRKYPGAAKQAFNLLEKTTPRIWGPTGRTPIRRRLSDRQVTEPLEFVAIFVKQ